MRRREEDEDTSSHLMCERCQQTVERALIEPCPFCSRHFCRNCAVRAGNAAFCSKPCAEGWFFADADEAVEDE